ncbi:MAG: pyridoxal phosphate-dependent decarboxylase family protein [Cyanobacteriota bacterium]
MDHPSAAPLPPSTPAPRCEDLSPFADPAALDPGLQAFLDQASNLLCQWLATASCRAPLPALSALPGIEPQHQGLSSQQLLADLHLIMEGAYNPGHPGAMAHLDPPALTGSIAADLIVAGLNNNPLAEELSPSLSRLERSLLGWLAHRLGLGDQANGVPASGGTLSNLMALICAREASGLQQRGDGVVLCSEDAHVSLDKAMRVMGLAADALQRLATDALGQLDIQALADALERFQRQGRPVIAVVATAGTTVRGAVDPLPTIAELCRRHDVWLHVDGAIGAVFGLVDSHQTRVNGLGLADSLTVNPQKLLGITKTSSVLLLKQPQWLARTFATGLPYMDPSWGGHHGGECGLQGSRPAEILKLWLGLRQLGLDGIEAVLDGAVRRRRRLLGLLSDLRSPSGRRLQCRSGPLHLLAFCPEGLNSDAAARWSDATRRQLLEAQLLLSRPLVHGRHHLKAVLGNPHTGDGELRRLASIVAAGLPL